MLEGNGVVVFRTAHVDEAVGADQKFAAVFYFEAFSPQRFQGGLVYGDEAFFPGERQTLHPPLVVKRHLPRDRLVELLDGEEPAVAQRSIYIVIGKLDMVFDQRLVLWLARPGRYGHAAEVFGKVFHRAVDLRLVPVRLYDSRLEVVGDYDFRDSTDVAQTTFCGIQEVIHLLRGDGHRKAVVRRRKCGHKDLTLHFLAGLNVHIGHRVPGEVHEQVLATLPIRRQHEGWLLCLCILIDMITELSVTVPVRIPCPVLAPEKIHRHVFPLQFRCDIWETLLEVLEPPVAVRRTAARQHTLNLWLFHGQKCRYGYPAGLCQSDVFVDRTLVQVQFTAYRPV